MAEEDIIVLNFGESLLRKSDVDLLLGPKWINDKLIGFCFEYYEREQFNHSADRFALISPSVTQFIRFASGQDLCVLLEPLHLPSKEYVFIPINDNNDTQAAGGSHWSLMIYVRSKQEFQHYDSFRGTNQMVAKKLVDKLQPFVQAPRGKLRFLEMDCPQQHNSYDCGIYVIAMAEHLIKEFCECFSISVAETVTQETVERKRQQIYDLIREVAQTDPNSLEHHLTS